MPTTELLQTIQKLQTVLFDMDGTIIHTMKMWDAIVGSFVGTKNIELFRQIRDKMPGRGMEQTCHTLRVHFNYTQNDQELTLLYEQRAAEIIEKMPIRWITGFLKFHELLKTRHIQMALVTNAPSYALNPLKKKLNLEELFGEHIYNSCVVASVFKPDPALITHAMNKLEADPRTTIIFEDTTKGMIAAHKAGLPHVITIYSDQLISDLEKEKEKPSWIIQDYKDLYTIFATMQIILQTKSPALTGDLS